MGAKGGLACTREQEHQRTFHSCRKTANSRYIIDMRRSWISRDGRRISVIDLGLTYLSAPWKHTMHNKLGHFTLYTSNGRWCCTRSCSRDSQPPPPGLWGLCSHQTERKPGDYPGRAGNLGINPTSSINNQGGNNPHEAKTWVAWMD